MARANPGPLAQWLRVGEGFGDGPANGGPANGVSATAAGDCSLAAREGSISPAFYWQLIDTERAAESRRAHTVILQAAPAAVVVAERVAAIRNPVLQKEFAGGCHLLAGLSFSQELINAYFKIGILDDSVTYQAAVSEYSRRS